MIRRLLLCALLAAAVVTACSVGGPADAELRATDARSPAISQEDLGPRATSGGDARAAAIARGARLLDDPVPDRLTYGWETNFGVHSVPYSEIVPGGPPRDGIPPIDSPVFLSPVVPRITCGRKSP